MKAAAEAVQRAPHAKLFVMDGRGNAGHRQRSEIMTIFRPGDLVIANDAATIPASLFGTHLASGHPVEVRLAGRRSLDEIATFSAIVFGEGDFRMRTEDRPAPPRLAAGDQLELGPLRATILCLLNHPRLVLLRFQGSRNEIWAGLARHGRPIQYSHVTSSLALWDTWTPIAGPPVAFEPPSAGFVLDWNLLAMMKAFGILFATITHASGISSTGDLELDAMLPFDEPYRIPVSTALALRHAQARGARIIAIGTTVVRALEHAASVDAVVEPGERLATQRIGAASRLRIVDAIVSGAHERGTSHFEMLRAFADDEMLDRMERELDEHDYRTHEFGDSIFLERAERSADRRSAAA
jgi:S-adenosylmethionine:tRNA ribosyltransferase-isomerase